MKWYNENNKLPAYLERKQPELRMMHSNPYYASPVEFQEPFMELANNLPQGAMVAGSFLSYCLSGNGHFGDIDFYFTSKNAYLETLALFTGRRLKYFKKYNVEPSRFADGDRRFINLKRDGKPTLQFITLREFDDVKDVVSTFDFRFLRMGLTRNKLHFQTEAMEDMKNKQLHIAVRQNPVNALSRTLKYVSRGYFMPRLEIEEIVESIKRGAWSDFQKPKLKCNCPNHNDSPVEVDSQPKLVSVDEHFQPEYVNMVSPIDGLNELWNGGGFNFKELDYY